MCVFVCVCSCLLMFSLVVLFPFCDACCLSLSFAFFLTCFPLLILVRLLSSSGCAPHDRKGLRDGFTAGNHSLLCLYADCPFRLVDFLVTFPNYMFTFSILPFYSFF